MKKIDVILTTTSPLHVAYPDNQDKTANIGRTTKTPVMLNGRMQFVPIYPANGFRGGLRRKARSRIVAHLKENEGAIPGDLYLGLGCGASSGSPDQTALSIEEILRARDNVYMGLFGGGARLHSSMYSVSDMNPIIETTLASGTVPRYCQGMVEAKPAKEGAVAPEFLKSWELLGSRTSIRVDDLFRVENPAEILNVLANPLEAVGKHQAAVMANREGRKTDGESKVDVANMMGIETIASGVPFHFRIDLDPYADEAKMGLILSCLSDLFRENAFGGWTRCGFGRVRVESIHVEFEDQNFNWDQLYPADSEQFTLPAEAHSFTEAADQAIASLKIADMVGFFEDFSAGKKAEKKAKDQAKKGAAA